MTQDRRTNYPPNTTQWKSGDLVIHDCDAKKPRMLMRVVRYLPTSGRVRAEYVDAELRRRQLERAKGRSDDDGWFTLADLHDPALWGIPLDANEDHDDWDRNFRRISPEVWPQ